MSQEETQTAAQSSPPDATIKVLAQHIKDLSFENLATRESIGDNVDPETAVTFDIRPDHIRDNIFGLMLELGIRSKNKTTNKELFIIELHYFISLEFSEMPQEQRLAMLVIEGGRLSFPFIRSIVRNVTVEGGLAPFNLEPIDFVGIYRQQMEKIQAANAADAVEETKPPAPKKRSSKKKSS